MNRRTSAVLAAVAAVVAVAALLPGAAVASHDPESTDYTVSPDDPAGNASEVSYRFDVELTDNFGDSRSGIDNVTKVTITFSEADLSGCEGSTPLSEPFTLSLVTSDGEESEFEDYEGSFSGGTADFDVSDPAKDYTVNSIIRLDLDSCVNNPSSEGWYQADATISGEAFGSGEQVTLDTTSHYFAICSGCDNESAARDELGPPPSEATPTPTPTATATPTPTPTATPTPTPTAQLPDDDPTATPTPTPTQQPDDSGPTPTEPVDDSTPTMTETPTPGGEGGDQQFFGTDPMLVVGVVAVVSIGIAAFGATRL